MSEFGHTALRGNGFCIDSWGAGPFLITAGGKTFRFGDSDQFGPYLATRHGDPTANPWPSEKSPFWHAYTLWREQGRRVVDDFICVFSVPDVERVSARPELAASQRHE